MAIYRRFERSQLCPEDSGSNKLRQRVWYIGSRLALAGTEALRPLLLNVERFSASPRFFQT